MKEIPSFFIPHPEFHFMEPGSVAFIPGWIILFLTILTLAILFPRLFQLSNKKQSTIINPYLLAFIVGSLMPVFDDILAFVFGPPFAHHSLFHSFFGSILTFLFFRTSSSQAIAKFAFFGNLYHIFFNFYFDYVTLFFPITYREFGLTDILHISTYWIKATHYPLIFGLFAYAVLKHFLAYKKEGHSA